MEMKGLAWVEEVLFGGFEKWVADIDITVERWAMIEGRVELDQDVQLMRGHSICRICRSINAIYVD